MPKRALAACAIAVTSGIAASLVQMGFAQMSLAQTAAAPLRPVASFTEIQDQAARSVALFQEAGKVITSPRCVNCHPATPLPLQGDAQRPHMPQVARGEAGMGVPGLTCIACHQGENIRLVGTTLKSIPGHPKWHLAPAEMAWQGKSLGEICTQIKDPARNGGLNLAQLHEHMAKDDLVGWAWNPGEGRTPAPGTQAAFGELIEAWIATGAHCP